MRLAALSSSVLETAKDNGSVPELGSMAPQQETYNTVVYVKFFLSLLDSKPQSKLGPTELFVLFLWMLLCMDARTQMHVHMRARARTRA